MMNYKYIVGYNLGVLCLALAVLLVHKLNTFDDEFQKYKEIRVVKTLEEFCTRHKPKKCGVSIIVNER